MKSKNVGSDFRGREVRVGDKVAYLSHRRTSSQLSVGKIESISNKTVVVNGKRRDFSKIVQLGAMSDE